MRMPKTIKGYISLIRRIEEVSVKSLKGFDDLSEHDKEILTFLDGNISNDINEIESRKPPHERKRE